jgi:hypothetical protein
VPGRENDAEAVVTDSASAMTADGAGKLLAAVVLQEIYLVRTIFA